MGYETRMYVVKPWNIGDDVPNGEELAFIELRKIDPSSHTGKLINRGRRKQGDGKPPFSLYARNPERQCEAVEVLREMAEEAPEPDRKKYLQELSNDIEGGHIITDCYGDYLNVCDIDEMILAMENDQKDEVYRRFTWALALLKAIRDTMEEPVKIITYGH